MVRRVMLGFCKRHDVARNRTFGSVRHLQLCLDRPQDFASLRCNRIGAVRGQLIAAKIVQSLPKNILKSGRLEWTNYGHGCDGSLLARHGLAGCGQLGSHCGFHNR